MRIVVASPSGDPRAVAYRCAARAAVDAGVPILASAWPRAGLFAHGDRGPGAVSLTHARSLCAAVALVPGPVGIDAEPESRDASAVRRLLAPGEKETLFPDAERLGFPPALAVFCAKEAVGKAHGTGLTGAERRPLRPTDVPGVWAWETLVVRLLRHRDSVVAVAFPRGNLDQPLEIVEL